MTSKTHSRKPVVAFDCLTGELISSYVSVSEASLDLNVSGGNISSVLSRKLKQTGGFVFRHPNEEFTDDDIVQRKRPIKRPLIAYTNSTRETLEFPSASEASRQLFGLDSNRTSEICKSARSPSYWKKSVSGYFFCFVGEEHDVSEIIHFAEPGKSPRQK